MNAAITLGGMTLFLFCFIRRANRLHHETDNHYQIRDIFKHRWTASGITVGMLITLVGIIGIFIDLFINNE